MIEQFAQMEIACAKGLSVPALMAGLCSMKRLEVSTSTSRRWDTSPSNITTKRFVSLSPNDLLFCTHWRGLYNQLCIILPIWFPLTALQKQVEAGVVFVKETKYVADYEGHVKLTGESV